MERTQRLRLDSQVTLPRGMVFCNNIVSSEGMGETLTPPGIEPF